MLLVIVADGVSVEVFGDVVVGGVSDEVLLDEVSVLVAAPIDLFFRAAIYVSRIASRGFVSSLMNFTKSFTLKVGPSGMN